MFCWHSEYSVSKTRGSKHWQWATSRLLSFIGCRRGPAAENVSGSEINTLSIFSVLSAFSFFQVVCLSLIPQRAIHRQQHQQCPESVPREGAQTPHLPGPTETELAWEQSALLRTESCISGVWLALGVQPVWGCTHGFHICGFSLLWIKNIFKRKILHLY